MHFELGMYVRNTLREGGFDWDPMLLDDIWSELICKAAHRKFGAVYRKFGTIKNIVDMIMRMQKEMQERRKSALEKQLTDQFNRFF